MNKAMDDDEKKEERKQKTELNTSYSGLFATCTKLQTQEFVFFLFLCFCFFLVSH